MTTAAALPPWRRVLAVVAHPDDESFGLGAVLDAFVRSGADVRVLCLTRGEASTLGGDLADLGAVRERELNAAAADLGITEAMLGSWPDGALDAAPRSEVVAQILADIDEYAVEGLVVFDPSGVTGHPDHRAATEAATTAGRERAVPVLAWTLPAEVADQLVTEFGAPFAGHAPDDIDLVLTVDRTTQRRAVLAHTTQAVPGSVLWRRLDLLGDREAMRWLTHPMPESAGS